MSMPMGHDRSKKSQTDDDDDPVIAMITKTGCLQLHYTLQECIYDKKDWRQCQKEVMEFRACMQQGRKNMDKKS